MLETVFNQQIRNQRPYYLPVGQPIKGIDGRYWLVFVHRDAEEATVVKRFFKRLVNGKQATHKLLCIDPHAAEIHTYLPKQSGDIPSPALLRTAGLDLIEKFLYLEEFTTDRTLWAGSFKEIEGIKRRYSLPAQLADYNQAIEQILERSTIYRRSTAYFDSGVLKLYEEPLKSIMRTEGKIRLLMDWQGFTKRDDVASLERLHDPEYRDLFIDRTLQEFVQTLDDTDFNSTELLAELVRLEFLQIKLIKMDSGRGIYHRKTGILSDNYNNHILHEGSDNFTRAAHSRNAESVTFFKSWEGNDRETIIDSIHDFDREWNKEDISFDLTQTFLQQVLLERDRRIQQNQPQIDTITPTELPPGETTAVIITGTNLDTVETIDLPDNDLIQIDIIDRTPTQIDAEITISPEYPPQAITEVRVKDKQGEYNITPTHPPQVKNAQQLPDFAEIDGFRAAAELILAGKYGQPQDFLYWLAQKQIQQFKITRSDLLDTLVDRGILFQHQKDGAQHCLMVMENFGVAVCADAVGLGKTRLAAAVARLYRQQTSTARIAIIAAQKLHLNWEREMSELGLEKNNHYGLFNKNRMSRRGQFIEDFTRFGADLVIIDEAHEGIRNDKNRIHKLCLELKERDSIAKRNRHYLLLTATPWNNRREDIYNILYPFLTRPEGFKEWDFPVEVSDWFKKRDTGVNQFVDNTPLFRRTYRQIFLQRTRQMLRDAMPDLNVYAKRQAEWLPVIFEPDTEVALDRIFTRFETDLFIPSADPIKYLSGNVEQRSLLANQRRFFLQRAESSMYALRRTIVNFRNKIELMQSRLDAVTPDASGLEQFLLLHYGFNTLVNPAAIPAGVFDSEDEDYEESEEEEESEGEEKQEKRQQLRRSIEIAIHHLEANPSKAKDIYQLMQSHCEADLIELQEIQQLLAYEFVKDHKRSQVTAQVQELIRQGKKVLLISTFSDTVVDYYRYMAQKPDIDRAGIGMAIGSTKYYRADDESGNDRQFLPHNATKNCIKHKGMKRQELFRLFAPIATCREPNDRPLQSEEIMVLIGSETLSVGQNMQDADYLINIDLPWNPMVLEQRIGRIDRPKQHHPDRIYIYYANSESQLLRQASRLKNLNKKLVGDRFNIDSENSGDLSNLGASIYGDTLFDDAILPDYVNFLGRLAQVRKTEQENWQENCYSRQEQTPSMYTQYELLFREDVSEKIRALGEDYLANPIALGAGGEGEVKQLVALTIDYFDPNGKLIIEERQTIYWNDKTGEKDAYGLAIATANQTPALGRVIPRERSLTELTELYDRLVKLKQEYLADLDREETTSDVKTASERLSRIQQRIQRLHLNDLPADISPKVVKTAIGKLDSWKESKVVEKLLRAYNDGEKSQLPDTQFLMEFLTEVDLLNLIDLPKAKKASLKISVNALLLKV
ncbi:helicase-related protein [Chamaesiphon minutus]|uniref:DNA/RNA helicase, superfamily II n=1 Tax=Chamaesiphon minutus (strain ATCC 27169 / PCC 6605) TaxID=1173020 RepID=K9UD02_CHAP6|nr:helicase-related protein [Chamaesiphon minutus]AFY92533.1 DNA/RNA helicase, superfamily II [Chamaesiphon minutus PCC 6605]